MFIQQTLWVNTSKMTSYSNLYRGNCVSKSSYDRSNVLECILALALAHTRTHTIRSSEWNNAVSLLWRNFTFGYTRCNRHREQKILSSSSGSYVMCRAAIIANRKCQMSIATRLLFWTASYRMNNTDSYQFFNLFTCWTFVSVPFVTLPVAINFNSHREHLPYFQSAMILAPDRTSVTNNFGFRAFPADCVGVPLTFRRTLQLPSLGRLRQESEFKHK